MIPSCLRETRGEGAFVLARQKLYPRLRARYPGGVYNFGIVNGCPISARQRGDGRPEPPPGGTFFGSEVSNNEN